MLLYENKKKKFLRILQIGINPFQKFVSTGEIKETLGMVPSRKDFMDAIIDLIESNENFILPIIGDTGRGKTHLFWALRNELTYNYIVHISPENLYRKFYYNIYSEFIETLGINVLRSITNQLCNQWGALERKFGFFYLADIEKVRKMAFNTLESQFKNKEALKDVIQTITSHQLDPYRRLDAENWLLGNIMDFKELSMLNVQNDLSKSIYAYTMLKLLIENAKLESIVFIDDFDRILSLLKFEEEVEEVFDPSWLYGKNEEQSISRSNTIMKVIDKISELVQIQGLKCIITLRSLDALEQIKELFSKTHLETLSLFKQPLFLTDFNRNDIFYFYREYIKIFLDDIGFPELLDLNTDPYYPLTEKILHDFFSISQGNPRNVIKTLINIFNEIIMSNESLEDIIANYEKIAHPKSF